MKYRHHHERLDAYRVAVEAARAIRSASWPAGEADAKSQAKRAANSVVLNIAEGTAREGKSRRYHYGVASGSAAEATAVLDIVDLECGPEVQQKLRRVAAMLRRLH